ncbi:MAG: LamG domain-containing protein [Kofleriaceae bacterium]
MRRFAWLWLLVGCSCAWGCDYVWDLRDAKFRDAGPPADQPFLHYTFDSIADGMTPEANGGPPATCTSCPTLVDGSRAMALSFDGTTQGLQIESGAFTPLKGPFTIALWLRVTKLGINACPLSKPYGSDRDDSFQLCLNGGQYLSFITGTDEVDTPTLGNLVTLGFFHVALTYDGSTKLVFINGHMSGMGGSDSFAPHYDASAGLVGYDLDDGSTITAAYDGAVDDLQVYDHALTVEEIQSLAF